MLWGAKHSQPTLVQIEIIKKQLWSFKIFFTDLLNIVIVKYKRNELYFISDCNNKWYLGFCANEAKTLRHVLLRNISIRFFFFSHCGSLKICVPSADFKALDLYLSTSVWVRIHHSAAVFKQFVYKFLFFNTFSYTLVLNHAASPCAMNLSLVDNMGRISPE